MARGNSILQTLKSHSHKSCSRLMADDACFEDTAFAGALFAAAPAGCDNHQPATMLKVPKLDIHDLNCACRVKPAYTPAGGEVVDAESRMLQHASMNQKTWCMETKCTRCCNVSV